MRALLDTHALLWWMAGADRLSPAARALFEDPQSELLWSSVSTAELAIKASIGRLQLARPLPELIGRVFAEDGIEPLELRHVHAFELGRLPLHHRDPFDRLLVAQARSEGVPLVSKDASISLYDVRVIW